MVYDRYIVNIKQSVKAPTLSVCCIYYGRLDSVLCNFKEIPKRITLMIEGYINEYIRIYITGRLRIFNKVYTAL